MVLKTIWNKNISNDNSLFETIIVFIYSTSVGTQFSHTEESSTESGSLDRNFGRTRITDTEPARPPASNHTWTKSVSTDSSKSSQLSHYLKLTHD